MGMGCFSMASEFPTIIEKGLFVGFDGAATLAVTSSAVGGLVVASVLKYADSVLKGYGTVTSVFVTAGISALLFGTVLDIHFGFGLVNVISSIALYSHKPVAAKVPATAKEVEALIEEKRLERPSEDVEKGTQNA